MSDEWLREKQGRRILKAVNGDRNSKGHNTSVKER